MINQLVKGIKEKDAPIVVGLDPMLSYLSLIHISEPTRPY